MTGMESETVLRASLDAIDGVRRRLMWAGYIAVLATILAFFSLDHRIRTGSNINGVIMSAALAVTCVISWSTFAVSIFITRMTKRILRAIDLAANRSMDR